MVPVVAFAFGLTLASGKTGGCDSANGDTCNTATDGPGEALRAYFAGETSEPPCELPVEDYQLLSKQDFIDRYVDPGVAVIMRNVPPLLQHKNAWSMDDFLTRFPDLKFAGNSPDTRDGDVLSGFKDMETSNPPRFFMQTDRGLYGDLMRGIRQDLTDEPKMLFETVATGPVLSVAGAKTWNRIHAHARAWQAQIHGDKLWWLTDYRSNDKMHPPVNLDDTFRHWGGNVCNYMDRRPMPSSKYCLNTPGSIMFVPDRWYHGTCNLDNWTVSYGMEGVVSDIQKSILFEDIASYDSIVDSCSSNQGKSLSKSERKFCKTGEASEFGKALPTAAGNGHSSMISYFLSQAKSGLTDSEIKNMLQAACKTGHRGVVEHMLSSREVPDAVRKTTSRFLTLPETVCAVAEAGTVGVPLMQLLLDRGAKPKGQCSRGSPMMSAVSSFDGGLAMVRLLENNGADSADPKLVAEAAAIGHLAITKHILQRQLDGKQVKPAAFDAALRSAAAKGHTSIARLLLETKASPVAKDRKGLSALDHAAKTGVQGLLKLLAPANTQDPDIREAASQASESAKLRAKKLIRENPEDRTAPTVLMNTHKYLKSVR